jgi:hypothetical protein
MRQVDCTMGQSAGMRWQNLNRSFFFLVLAMFAVFTAAVAGQSTAANAQDTWAMAVIAEMRAQEQKRSGATQAAPKGMARSIVSTSAPAAPAPSRAAKQAEPKTRVASLGREAPVSTPRRSASGGSVNWLASASCLDGSLKSVVTAVASSFGPVTVNSTCRSRSHNRRVGGAPRSKHLSGDAVDFRVGGSVSAVYAYLRGNGNVGGLKHYGGGLFHIDNGDRRSW